MMHEIFHIVPIQSTPAALYRALVDEAALNHWWLEGARTSGEVGTTASFPLSSKQGFIKMKILDLQANKRVYWECSEHLHRDWIGTTVEFNIVQGDAACELHFRHSNWQDTTGVFGLVSYYWAALYLTRLKRLLEGSPV